MQLITPPPEVARAGLRALKTVALADGTFHDLERGFLESLQRNILKTDFAVDDLEPITPEELAAAVPDPEFRGRIVRGCLLVAMIDTEASKVEQGVIESFAKALSVETTALADFRRVVTNKLLLFRLDIGRRSFIGTRVKQHVGTHGVRGLASIVGGFAGFENGKLAEKYRALEGRAEGTLGRAYFDFEKKNGFALPGEKGGAPEPIVFHDCLHVLAEYDTTPEEEAQIISFQAGCQKDDPIFSMFFALAQFHLGIQISPVATTAKAAVDPELVFRAFVRGSKCTKDLIGDWDPWPDFDTPVNELRKRYGIEPRT